MKSIFISVLFLFLHTMGLSQVLTTEVSYLKSEVSLPYKLEQIFKTDSTTYYVKHRNSNSRCIIQKELQKGDTTIISEEYYKLHIESREKLGKHSVGHVKVFNLENGKYLVVKTDHNYIINHELFIEHYETEVKVEPYSSVSVGDLGKDYPEIVSMIKMDIIKPNFDSLQLTETYQSYFVNNDLVKFQVLNKEHNRILVTKRSINPFMIKFHTTFTNNDTNTIDRCYYINKDTSQVITTHRSPWYSQESCVTIEDSMIIRSSRNGNSTVNIYEKPGKLLNHLILNDVVYSDEPFWGLEIFDDSKHVLNYKETSDNSIFKYDFEYDESGNIKQKKVYKNGELKTLALYKYYD